MIARSTANAPRTLNPPIATGNNAATPRKKTSDSSTSSGNAISSAIASELVARAPVCWPATADPPSTTPWSPANACLEALDDIAVARPRAQRRGDQHLPTVA